MGSKNACFCTRSGYKNCPHSCWMTHFEKSYKTAVYISSFLRMSQKFDEHLPHYMTCFVNFINFFSLLRKPELYFSRTKAIALKRTYPWKHQPGQHCYTLLPQPGRQSSWSRRPRGQTRGSPPPRPRPPRPACWRRVIWRSGSMGATL